MKTCPFCGGDAHRVHKPKFGEYSVVCSSCGAGTDDYLSEDACVAAWNGRVDSDDPLVSARLRKLEAEAAKAAFSGTPDTPFVRHEHAHLASAFGRALLALETKA